MRAGDVTPGAGDVVEWLHVAAHGRALAITRLRGIVKRSGSITTTVQPPEGHPLRLPTTDLHLIAPRRNR